jgi:type IV pilus assembly protein PilB
LDKETIVSAAPVYEELTDPGDWEQLKRELDQNQDLIVSSQVDTSFASTLASWS